MTLMDDDDAIVLREVQYGSFCNLQLRAEGPPKRFSPPAKPNLGKDAFLFTCNCPRRSP